MLITCSDTQREFMSETGLVSCQIRFSRQTQQAEWKIIKNLLKMKLNVKNANTEREEVET